MGCSLLHVKSILNTKVHACSKYRNSNYIQLHVINCVLVQTRMHHLDNTKKHSNTGNQSVSQLARQTQHTERNKNMSITVFIRITNKQINPFRDRLAEEIHNKNYGKYYQNTKYITCITI